MPPTEHIAAGIIATGEEINEVNMLSKSLSTHLNKKINMTIPVDSKELFKSLSTQHNSINKSILEDNVKRNDF